MRTQSAFISVLLVLLILRTCKGHGRMLEPPARNTMWRFGYSVKPPYDDSAIMCGGFKEQWRTNKGKCGVCGDDWNQTRPRPHETGGKYWRNLVTRTYPPGGNVDIVLDLNANHWGWYEFSLCPLNEFNQLESEKCFDHNLLQLVDNSGTRGYAPRNRTAIVYLQVKLPEGLTCRRCVLRWHWKAGNNWGKCDDGTTKLGCGPQEMYRNCADIAIYDEDPPLTFRRRQPHRRYRKYCPPWHFNW